MASKTHIEVTELAQIVRTVAPKKIFDWLKNFAVGDESRLALDRHAAALCAASIR